MTKAMDDYDASSNADGKLEKALAAIEAKLLIIGFDSDWLYPPSRGKEIQMAAMKNNIASSYICLEGAQGHDSFLFATEKYSKIIKTFLES